MGIIEAIRKIEREEGIEIGMERGMEKGIKRGMEKGMEKKTYEFVRNLLIAKKFSIAEIANLVGVTEAFVNNVKKEIKPGNQ